MEQQLILQTDPNCGDDISKILLVYDEDNDENNEVIDFLTGQGYHVVTLFLEDNMFPNIGKFLQAFEVIVKAKKTDFVFAIVHYSKNTSKDVCMYCSSTYFKNSLLMKHAFGCLYVNYGREKCCIISPERCCDYSTRYLPRAQIEGMSIDYTLKVKENKKEEEGHNINSNIKLVSAGESTNIDTPQIQENNTKLPEIVWIELGTKIETLRLIASHKEKTKHVRTIKEVIPEIVESSMDTDDLFKFIYTFINSLGKCLNADDENDTYEKRTSMLLGMSGMEWDEHKARAGNQALLLMLKRCQLTIEEPLLKIGQALSVVTENKELSQLCLDLHSFLKNKADNIEGEKKGVLLSSYPSLKQLKASSEVVSKSGPWKEDIKEKPIAEEGTHLDKLKSQFIPPHLRAQMENEMKKEPEQLQKEKADFIKLVNERDAQYQKLKIEAEIREGQFLSEFSTTTIRQGKRYGGNECPK